MISNERPSPRGYRPYGQSHSHTHPQHSHSSHYAPKPHVAEDTLKSDQVQIERKTFVFTLKENPRGRFLRITEDVNGRRDTIIIPATGLGDFKRLLENMVEESDKVPVKATTE
ncbi:MAG TPA: PUR family DNA/RNA-binding protein [Verrucomicrobiae bacterium]|jgi:hypothetical protein